MLDEIDPDILDAIAAGIEPEIAGKTGEPLLRTQCSWCGKHIAGMPEATLVSHGICEPCLERELADIAEFAEVQPVRDDWDDLDDVGPEAIGAVI